jgi:Raf kinase inhibitor-like YbhB/YbcL family protein
MKNLFALVLFLTLLAACAEPGGETSQPVKTTAAEMTVTSTAFQPGGKIPTIYTCQGNDFSPPLAWSNPPEGTKSLALIMDDPDAPMGTWVHWVVYNLPPGTSELLEGASAANAEKFNLPVGTQQGQTSFKRSDYGGPCPPSGSHRYIFHLYALDIPLDSPGMDRAALVKAMDGHILASGTLMGTYQKE